MATHSSILAWRIPWTEELGGLQSMGRKESDTTKRLHFHFHFHWDYKMKYVFFSFFTWHWVPKNLDISYVVRTVKLSSAVWMGSYCKGEDYLQKRWNFHCSPPLGLLASVCSPSLNLREGKATVHWKISSGKLLLSSQINIHDKIHRQWHGGDV